VNGDSQVVSESRRRAAAQGPSPIRDAPTPPVNAPSQSRPAGTDAGSTAAVQQSTLRAELDASYARTAAEHYARIRKAVLDSAQNLYFAAGCHVFEGPDNAQQVQAMLIVGNQYQLLENDPLWARDQTIGKEVEQAERKGWARASEPGACNYWREHPEAVYELREQAKLSRTVH